MRKNFINSKTINIALVFVLFSSLAYSNPFEEGDVKGNIGEADIKITESEIATVAGIDKIEEGYPIEGTIAHNNLRMRSWPWGAVLGKYSKGTKVKILGESGEFYLVEVDGQQG